MRVRHRSRLSGRETSGAYLHTYGRLHRGVGEDYRLRVEGEQAGQQMLAVLVIQNLVRHRLAFSCCAHPQARHPRVCVSSPCSRGLHVHGLCRGHYVLCRYADAHHHVRAFCPGRGLCRSLFHDETSPGTCLVVLSCRLYHRGLYACHAYLCLSRALEIESGENGESDEFR